MSVYIFFCVLISVNAKNFNENASKMPVFSDVPW